MTITRVRGRIILTETTGVLTNDFFGLGLIVEDRNSTAAEVPKPFADEHADWLAWMPLSRVGLDGITGTFNSWEIDVRSQRRMDEVGQTLWLTMDAAVTSTWSATVVLSVLQAALAEDAGGGSSERSDLDARPADRYRGAGGGRQYSPGRRPVHNCP